MLLFLYGVFVLDVIKPLKNHGPKCKTFTLEGILYKEPLSVIITFSFFRHYRQVSRVPVDELSCDQRLLPPV